MGGGFPQLQHINKVVDFPVVLQWPIFMVQPVWVTMEILQLLFNTVIDVPVVQVVQVSQVVDFLVVVHRPIPMVLPVATTACHAEA